MFKYGVNESKAVDVQGNDFQSILDSVQEYSFVKMQLIDASNEVLQIEEVSSNIESAVRSIKESGLKDANWSILNSGNSLESLLNETIAISDLAKKTVEEVNAIEGRVIAALESADESLWDKFINAIKSVWTAISNFFRNLWLRVKGLFSDDKDFYAKAVAAYDRIDKDPEIKESVDELVKTAKIEDGKVVWDDAVVKKTASKRAKKKPGNVTEGGVGGMRDPGEESFGIKAIEDWTLSFKTSDKATGGFKGNGFFEYSKFKPFIEFVKNQIKNVDNAAYANGGPWEFAHKEMVKMIKQIPSVEITEKIIDNFAQAVFNVCQKLPSMKDKVESASGGVVKCTKLEVNCPWKSVEEMRKPGTRAPEIDAEFVIVTKDGTLGQLGWTKKNLLEAFDVLTKNYAQEIDDRAIDNFSKDIQALLSKVKFPKKSEGDSDDMNDMRRDFQKLVSCADKFSREYMKFLQNLNSKILVTRAYLKAIPAFIIKNFDVGKFISDNVGKGKFK